MTKIIVTTKTPAQIAAEFETAFKDIQPPEKTRPLTQADRLEPYRAAILKQRRRGLTWAQIAAGMAPPPIAEKVSGRTLNEVFGQKPKPTRTATPVATPAAAAAASTPATPPRRRLILDPVTMQPIPQKPA